MRAEIELPYDTDLGKFKPISGYVVVIPHEAEAKRIIITADHWKHESFRGTLMAVADDVEGDLRPGQDVLFSPYSHRVMELNGNYLFLVHSSDVVALVVAGEP